MNTGIDALLLHVEACADAPEPLPFGIARMVAAEICALRAAVASPSDLGAADVAALLRCGESTARERLAELEKEGTWGVYRGARKALFIPRAEFGRWQAEQGAGDGDGKAPAGVTPLRLRASYDPSDLLGRSKKGRAARAR